MMMTYNTPKTLIVILGATATGKTGISISLAERLKTEIISCDSRQFYKELPIGTAMPSEEQQSKVKHHFIASRSIRDCYTCGQYEKDALALLDNLFRQYNTVIMTGGSGLYINAVCDGFDDVPETNIDLRNSLRKRYEQNGLNDLLEELQKADPAYYEIVDRKNSHRVMRALEVCIETGRPYSSFRSGRKAKRPFEVIKIGITMPRPKLYERINKRVDAMIKQGLEEEARKVYGFRDLNSLKTVGYSELFEYFDGKITREEAIDLIKRNSRRYAKRQDTWFARDTSTVWFDALEPDVVDRITSYIEDHI